MYTCHNEHSQVE